MASLSAPTGSPPGRHVQRPSGGRISDSEWQEHVDPRSGKVFFHNVKTNETTWYKPGWSVVYDERTGQQYYYNYETNETCTHNPDDEDAATYGGSTTFGSPLRRHTFGTHLAVIQRRQEAAARAAAEQEENGDELLSGVKGHGEAKGDLPSPGDDQSDAGDQVCVRSGVVVLCVCAC